MLGHRIKADIQLTASAPGREFSLPSGTHSVLVVLPAGEAQIQLGAAIETPAGTPLTPGGQHEGALVEFVADEARIYASPGVAFKLWYGGTIGSGTITEVLGDNDEGDASD